MEYNKNGEVTRYFNLDDIARTNISSDIKEEFQNKFKKRVYYDHNGSCKIGTLCGLEINGKLSELYYILKDEKDNLVFTSCFNSITLL